MKLSAHSGPSFGCAVLYLVTQSCLTLCDPMDCSPPGSSVHGEWCEELFLWAILHGSFSPSCEALPSFFSLSVELPLLLWLCAQDQPMARERLPGYALLAVWSRGGGCHS